jgi:TolA-binding protein
MQDNERALELYRDVYKRYPESVEAPRAMLAAGAIEVGRGDVAAARSLFEAVTDVYQHHVGAAAEAEWQLAQIEEAQQEWVEASLRYKSIAKTYPGTSRALEAPLHVARLYEELGESSATRTAYERAIRDYKKITGGPHPLDTRIRAEDYIYQAYVLQGDWEQGARHLLELPERYPRYEPYRDNYVIAARIYDEELDDRSKAIDALERCIEKYPGTSAAGAAAVMLAGLGGRE